MATNSLPSLSIVIPVYNEPEWIRVSVGDADAALRESPFDEAEFVVVDDGSDEPTRQALESLRPSVPLRVIRQANAGRFAARRTGIEAAGGDMVLLLDSRVSLDRDSLAFLAARLRDGDARGAWNGHVESELEGNPYARFWWVLSHAAFRDYLREPRTTSFGLEEYDRYPKGTGCFVAPRTALVQALAEFQSHYDDARQVNDDTVMLRSIAARQRIHISPGFAAVYRARGSLRPFLRHVFHRGIVFFDGFARPGARFFPVLVAFFPASAAFAILGVRRPKLALASLATVPAVAAGAAAALRRPPRDVAAFAALALPFLFVYSAGIWRGALLAAATRMRR